MNLKKKKQLAARTLKVGINRIKFNSAGISEIKESITKQDIIALHNEGIILIKPIKGRKKVIKRKTRKGPGKIKFKINMRKENYVKITRKLRRYIMLLKNQNIITKELYYDLRKKIKNKGFKSLSGLKDYIENFQKIKSMQTKDKVSFKKINKNKIIKKSKRGKK